MSEKMAGVGGDAGHDQGSCKGIRAGGICRWKSIRGERGEERLMAALGREEEEEKSRVGLGRAGEESRRLLRHRSGQGEEGVLGNAMQGLHSPLPVYMEKIPWRVRTAGRQLETKKIGCQNPTHHWVTAASAHLKVQERIHPCRCLPRAVALHQQLFCQKPGTGF